MPRIPFLLLIPPLAFALLAGLAFVKLRAPDDGSLPSAFVGSPAPNLPQRALAGFESFAQADLADGQVKLVNFFASWCPPCRAEHPNLMRLSQEGLAIYGVNFKDQDAQATAFLTEAGSPYKGVLSDPQGFAALDWGVTAPPETFVLDGQGHVVARLQYPITQRVVDDQLAEALAKAAQSLN